MVDVEDVVDDLMSELSQFEEQLEHELQNFCDDCDPIIDRMPLPYWGSTVYLEQAECEPGDMCQRSKKHEEIHRVLNIVKTAISSLEKNPEGAVA